MPIADLAGDAAGREIAREMTSAEAEGRVVKHFALSDIQIHPFSRDRNVLDEDEMGALTASIAEHVQQTPVEALRLSGGQIQPVLGDSPDRGAAPS